ncbi:MAG: branched-chain amino acid ABC transporter permease, partial [Actinobacteria bacterium]|nr:branched-chain amino acid ABC transporter permease [Actinomycetota bacterium]
MDYFLHILILINIYIIVAISLNLISGYTGLLSLAHAAFFGIGAYATALMWLYFQTGFWVNIWVGILFSIILGIIIAYPSLRIYDDYFAIATFGFQMIVFSIFNNWVGFTKGPLGIPGIPSPSIFGWEISSHWAYFLLSGFFAVLVYWLTQRLVNSPFGLVLKSIREDEIFTKAAGKNITKYKMLVFIIGGSMASIAGALYAHYISYIDPTSFTINESIFMISIVIIGGMASLRGSVLGAVILVILPELLRFIGLPNAVAANLRQIFYGALLVLFMMYRPRGFVGEY